MGALTKAEYEERVKLACGNVPAAHPIIAAGMHTTAINNAPNWLIRANRDLFPEHNDNSWTIGPTAAGDDSVAIPANLLILEKVTHSEDAVPVGGSDWTLIQERPVAIISNVATIGLIAKPTTATGYPTMVARKGNVLVFNVTTSAGYETYFRLRGLAGEMRLSASGETFRMHEDFDSIIVQLAAAEVFEMIGQYDRADALRAAVGQKLSAMRSVVASERAARPVRVRVAGAPWS